MNASPIALAPGSPLVAAPLRSEAFVEDLDLELEAAQAELPWTLREALTATVLCAVPLAVATLGTLVNFVGLGH